MRGVRRNPPDIAKLGRALIQIVMDEAATEAAAQEQLSRKQSEPENGIPETKHD